MATFVARFTRVISQELRDAKSSSAEAPIISPQPNLDTPATLMAEGKYLEREVIQMDMRMAELLENGTRIFPDPGTGYGSNWYIFREHKTSSPSAETVFLPLGMIGEASNSKDFVSAAYQYVLLREVDATGHELYPSLIENRQLSRRDVLKALAESDEATDRHIKLVIVPEPSSWFGKIIGGQVIPCVVEKTED